MQNQAPPVRSTEIRYRYEFFAQGEPDFDVRAGNRFEEIFRRKIPQKMQGTPPPDTTIMNYELCIMNYG
jgi:hypothetical protein